MSILFDHDEDPTQRPKKYRKEQYRSTTASKYDDLLVFGYQCKLFRNDAPAIEVNEGKQLIPWMGNENIMIDRYDCRGHLYHVEDFDFSNIKSEYDLSSDEIEVENICDEERYMDLKKDMVEEEILQEEEEKRSKNLYDPNTAYQTIGFDYGGDKNDESYIQYCTYYGLDSKDPTVLSYYQGQQSYQYDYDYERPPPPPEPPKIEKKQEVQPEKFILPDGLDIPANIELGFVYSTEKCTNLATA